MRPADLLVASLAFATSAAAGSDLSATDVDDAAGRRNLTVKVETVVDHGKPYLLVRLQATDIRILGGLNGAIDSVSLQQRRLDFFPVRVACHRATLISEGKRQAPDAVSLCRDFETLTGTRAAPLFIAFAAPPRGGVEIVIPVTVLPPSAPLQARPSRDPVVPAAKAGDGLLGQRDLVIRTLISDKP